MIMLRQLWAFVALLCVVSLASVFADPREVESNEFKDDFGDDYDDRLSPAADLDQRFEFQLEHNIPSGDQLYTKRGKVEILFSSSSPKPKVTFTDLPVLGDVEIAHLEKLLRSGKHYSVRVRSDPHNPSSPYVMTSIPMCQLAGTRMREDLAFHLSDSGKLMAVEYLTPFVSASTCAEYQTRDLKSIKLSVQGSVLKAQNGPVPPKQVTAKPKKAPKGVKNPVKSEEGAPGEEENQSLFRRYWYIIVPVILLGLFGGDSGPAPAAGGAAGGAAPAGGAPRRR